MPRRRALFSAGCACCFSPARPELGPVFRGRLTENFKLLSGTWVNVGELRLALIAALSPLASDIVICGHNEERIGILVFPNLAASRELVGEEVDAADLAEHPVLQEQIRRRMVVYNHANPASSRRVAAVMIQVTPPSLENNEITDKGYINQRGVLENRARDVSRLYARGPSGDVTYCTEPDRP